MAIRFHGKGEERNMWITIAVIVLIIAALILFQYFSDAGSRIICIKPRDNIKGKRVKNTEAARTDAPKN